MPCATARHFPRTSPPAPPGSKTTRLAPTQSLNPQLNPLNPHSPSVIRHSSFRFRHSHPRQSHPPPNPPRPTKVKSMIRRRSPPVSSLQSHALQPNAPSASPEPILSEFCMTSTAPNVAIRRLAQAPSRTKEWDLARTQRFPAIPYKTRVDLSRKRGSTRQVLHIWMRTPHSKLARVHGFMDSRWRASSIE